MSKKIKKVEILETLETSQKNDLKYSFISKYKLDLGYIIAESNEVFSIDKKQALELKSSIFFKNGSIKEVI